MQHPTHRSRLKQFVTVLACAVAGFSSQVNVTAAQPSDGAPSIVVASEPVHAVIGEDVTLSAEVTGSHPLRYCWRKDGAVLRGESGAKLKLKNVRSLSAGEYAVEVANSEGTTVSEPMIVRVCAPNLRIYRQHGIKLTFKARKCVRYTIECKNLLSQEVAWNVFAKVEKRSGTVRLTDHAATSHLLCVFRLKAEDAGRCSGHNDDDDDGHGDDDDDCDEDDDGDDRGDDDDDD